MTTHGGAATLRAHYEQVSAYHHNNYRPLMWRFFRPYRAALFRLSHLLTFRCATHDESLIAALQYIQRYQHTTRALLPAEIALDFASVRWQALIKTRHKLTLMLHRRHLEVCVFHYLEGARASRRGPRQTASSRTMIARGRGLQRETVGIVNFMPKFLHVCRNKKNKAL